MWRNTSREPHISTDHTVMADDGLSTEDSRTGIHHHTVFNSRVTFFLGITLINTERTECNTLINLNMIADNGCFANHNSCSMVNTKMLSDFCCWMNIDSGFTMRMFGDH